MIPYIIFGLFVTSLISLPMDFPRFSNPFYSAAGGVLAMVGAAWLASWEKKR